jgi:hypothetical protein
VLHQAKKIDSHFLWSRDPIFMGPLTAVDKVNVSPLKELLI